MVLHSAQVFSLHGLYAVPRHTALRTKYTDSDATVKQILLFINRQTSFILEDLDDYHVLIKENMEVWVRTQLEQEVRLDMKASKCAL